MNTQRKERMMPRTHGEPIPDEIPSGQRAAFAALRSYRRKIGQELTVEQFKNRRRYGAPVDVPQTKEGVLAILRAKGLAP
jgi:ribosomal protein S21